MTDYQISDLSSLSSPASGDLLSAVDVSDTTTAPAGSGGSNKKLPLSALLSWIQSNLSFSSLTSFATSHCTLDDGSGNATIAGTLTADGVVAATAGTDTSVTATASTPTFVSGTAKQLSTTQDAMLYIAVKTAASQTVALSIGSTSSASTTLITSGTMTPPIGTVITLRVPKGWYVKFTGTVADWTFVQVTC